MRPRFSAVGWVCKYRIEISPPMQDTDDIDRAFSDPIEDDVR